jgi:uncharacterized protein YbaP (TraB family)
MNFPAVLSVSTSILMLLLMVLQQSAYADTSLWKISRDGRSLYLGGTIHVLRESDYPLPVAFEQAFSDSTLIVFETDLRQLSSSTFQQSLLERVRYPAGESLQNHLTPEAMAALQAHCSAADIPIEVLLPFKPAWSMLTLLGVELHRLGIDQAGVDQFFLRRAEIEGKEVLGLETIEQQLDFITHLGTGDESELILHTIDELGQTEALLNDMVSSWRRGDREALNSTFIVPLAQDYPRIYQILLVDRNRAWLPHIEIMLQDDATELVLVGSAHLVGADGLLRQLQLKGYQITQH